MFRLFDIKGQFSLFLNEWQSSDAFINARTSGSTGNPKEIRLSKKMMTASARATNRFFGITETSVLVCPLSADYIAGKMMLVRAIEAHCTLYAIEPSNNIFISDIFHSIPHITLMPVVPSQLLSLREVSVPIKKIDNLIVGGAPLDNSLEKMLLASGINGYVTYGMTETCSHVALRKLGADCYTALPDISFMKDCDSRLIIEWRIDGDVIRLLTNDVVELLNDRCFRWLGRFDNVINSGGIKIFPEELEERLSNYFDFPFVVCREKNEKWGEIPVLLVAGKSVFSDAIIDSIMKDVLPQYHIPKKIYRIEMIPIARNGKINRDECNRIIETSC